MQILNNVDLTSFNTFGLSVRAKYFYELANKNDLPVLAETTLFQENPVLLLGGGSNIIFTQDYAGLVIHLVNKGIRVIEEDDGFATVEVQAGEIWHDFVQWSLAQGFSGLENLSLIPGTVGAVPVQNIGAYGIEVKDSIESVECFDCEENRFVFFEQTSCAFSYRDSVFKSQYPGRFIIVAVRFKLDKCFKPQLHYGPLQSLNVLYQKGQLSARQVADTVCQTRRKKLPDPAVLGNAGSFFKNPLVFHEQANLLLQHHPYAVHYPQEDNQVKFAAGWLIEQAGLKGFQIGGAAVHDQQALVLVNKHQASAQDVQDLAQFIQKRVLQKYGIELEIEPPLI